MLSTLSLKFKNWKSLFLWLSWWRMMHLKPPFWIPFIPRCTLMKNPIVTLSPMIEDLKDSFPPFYIFLNIHDKILHNCLLDSGASHNLMPKAVMDELRLSITKPYHDLFSFDSRKAKCLGLIKHLVVNLTQLPSKSIMMDIVVADIPPKFCLSLSQSWSKRLGGTL